MSDSDSEVYARDSQSQFVSKEGDDEVLWEVVEITGEKPRFYKVRWAGVDPETNKPWAQSWVAKSDCTDDLVREWKRKKLQKKKGTKARASGVSHTSTRASLDTSSTATKRSTRVASAIRSPEKKGKRTRSTALFEDDEAEEATAQTSIRPKKKRKINVEKPSPDKKTAIARSLRGKKPVVSESESDAAVVSKGKAVRKEEEEESESHDEGPSRHRLATPTPRPPARRSKPQPRLKTPTPPPSPTPEPDVMYLKYKSGKLSTPMQKKKIKRASESIADSVSSSSDEIEEIVPPPPPSPPQHSSPAQTPSHTAIQDVELPDASPPPEMYEYVNFDPDSTQKENSSPISPRSNGSRDDSYRRGIVPETQTQSSNNTQSQSQPLVPQRQPSTPPSQVQPESDHSSHPGRKMALTKPSRQPTLVLPAPPSTPGRASLISRMKPRTPSSSSISLPDYVTDIIYGHQKLEMHQEEDEDELGEFNIGIAEKQHLTTNHKAPRPLRAIPRLSPEVFRPHLSSEAPSSSRQSHGSIGPSAAEEFDEADVRDLVSSIEQFSSPEKAGRGRKRKMGRAKTPRKKRERGVGVEAEAEAEAEASGESPTEEDEDSSLEEAVLVRGPQLAARARAKEVQRQREYIGEPREGKGKRKTLFMTKAKPSGKEAEKPRSGTWWMHKESGREKQSKESVEEESESVHLITETQIVQLREEEEESTQDLAETPIVQLQEEDEAAQDLMADVADSRPAEDVEMAQDWHVEPSPEVLLPDEVLEPLEHSVPIVVPRKDELETRSRSKSKSSSHGSRSAERRRSKETLILPPTASIPSPTSMESQSQEHDNAPDFVASLALLNEKSRENAQLVQEIVALREALLAAHAPRPRELELEQELQVVRTNLEAAQAALMESERRVSDALRGKESAEKEREVFRDCYAKASGYATTVREENAELEKQAKIAKEQATMGVEAVKATYSARVKALEDDVRMYKRLATFIMEKDVRTNDEVRKRAAEEPELRTRCGELAKENRVLKNEIANLQDDLEEKEIRVNKLERQLNTWKTQATMLNTDLNKVKSAQEGDDRVYQCGWRIDDALNVPCEQVFTTYDEFERHMFSDKHLDKERAYT